VLTATNPGLQSCKIPQQPGASLVAEQAEDFSINSLSIHKSIDYYFRFVNA